MLLTAVEYKSSNALAERSFWISNLTFVVGVAETIGSIWRVDLRFNAFSIEMITQFQEDPFWRSHDLLI